MFIRRGPPAGGHRRASRRQSGCQGVRGESGTAGPLRNLMIFMGLYSFGARAGRAVYPTRAANIGGQGPAAVRMARCHEGRLGLKRPCGGGDSRALRTALSGANVFSRFSGEFST